MGKSIRFITIIIFITAGYSLLILSIPTQAQTPNCGGGTPQRAEGLVTTPNLFGKFATTGGCVTDPKVAFLPFKIPTYGDLKSLYFTQAKTKTAVTKHAELTGDKTEGDVPLTGSTDHIYAIGGSLTISNNIAGNQTGLIFVDKDLNINPSNNKLTHGTKDSGLVFVVGGNVNIDQSVTQLDAVIIAQGTIYTAGLNCATSNVSANQLIINGSLISLNEASNETSPIKFCRTLSDNKNPAELINHQVKYLVILKDIFSETSQEWSEIP